jgi:hypothetical protein
MRRPYSEKAGPIKLGWRDHDVVEQCDRVPGSEADAAVRHDREPGVVRFRGLDHHTVQVSLELCSMNYELHRELNRSGLLRES